MSSSYPHRAHRSALALLLGAALLAATLAACGGSDYHPPPSQPSGGPSMVSATLFTQSQLVSDTAGAAPNTDPNLVNAWGLAFNPSGFAWVANNGTATSTLYDGNGTPQTLVVATPPAPTGIVYNGSGDFQITQNGVTAASPFIFSSESGAIAAWSPTVNRTATVTMYDGSGFGSVYKGLAIASYNGANYLYASDFHNGRVDVFDASFAKTTLPGGFQDPALPAGYAPFGIQAIGNRIYVSYAFKETNGDDEVHGPGMGVVDVFDTGGNLITQLVNGGALNAPWGMALAPANFGTYGGMLLVGNFGDGTINAYDPNTGAAVGTLSKADGSAIVIDGLWGIAFGPGVNNQPSNTLFFTAGPGDEAHGSYGRLDMM